MAAAWNDTTADVPGDPFDHLADLAAQTALAAQRDHRHLDLGHGQGRGLLLGGEGGPVDTERPQNAFRTVEGAEIFVDSASLWSGSWPAWP